MIASLLILAAFHSSPLEKENAVLRREVALLNNRIEWLEWRAMFAEQEVLELRKAATQPVK